MTPKIIDETDLCQITAHTERKKSQRNLSPAIFGAFQIWFFKKISFSL